MRLTDLGGQGDNWNDLLKEVVTFNSVEEFWGIYVSSFTLWFHLLVFHSQDYRTVTDQVLSH